MNLSSEPINWLTDSLGSMGSLTSVLGQNIKARSETDLNNMHRSYYYSEVPSLFLSELNETKGLASQPLWLARDGLDSLRQIRNMGRFDAYWPRIAIPHKLVGEYGNKHKRGIFPSASYRVTSRILFNKRLLPEKIIILTGPTCSANAIEYFQDRVYEMKRALGAKAVLNIPIFLNTLRDDQIVGLQNREKEKQFAKIFEDIIRKKLVALPMVKWVNGFNLKGVCYIDAICPNELGDSYLVHLLASKGAGTIRYGGDCQNETWRRFTVSPYHHIEIKTWI